MDDNITISILEYNNYGDSDITISSLDGTIFEPNTITLDTTSMSSLNNGAIIGPYPSYNVGINTGNTTIGAIGSQYTFTGGFQYGTTTSPGSDFTVKGNAEFEGDVKIKGISLSKTLDDIQKRLAILVPDPAKLEHFEALKKAYEHYKTLEALCEIPKKDD